MMSSSSSSQLFEKDKHVLIHDSVVYNAFLQRNNQFYLIQIVQSKDLKQYALIKQWGWLNNKKGSNRITSFGTDQEQAIVAFCKSFVRYTRNSWAQAQQNNFHPKTGAYVYTKPVC